MDPATQSAQISSSQGAADGHNSAAKDSKLSDSFLSSSPVSLIQSPQEKRVVLGSDKPCEGVATSLRFPSQPGSFSPGNYGGEAGPPEGQPDSPIKTSPVSERIKALEALAAKKKEHDFRSDGGFPHFRDRHFEKSPTEQNTSTSQKKGGSTDPESPESPFEVLGEPRAVNEFEDTVDWMRAHLPPAPDFDAVDVNKGTQALEKISPSKEVKEADIVIPDVPEAFASIPDAFLDSPIEAPELKDEFIEVAKQPSVEDESEFDLSFLPTTYMWDQQEKSSAPVPPDPLLPASPAPPTDFSSPSPPLSPPASNAKLDGLDANKASWGKDLETQEIAEVDSSGESDDTVIEDGASVTAPPVSNSCDGAPTSEPTATPTPSVPSAPTEKENITPVKSEKRLMHIPTINVIETDEPNYSEEEMELEVEEDEDYEVVKAPAQEAPLTPEPLPEATTMEPLKIRPLETEFMEGYSPPSSPVDSDAENSPKHEISRSEPEVTHVKSAWETDELQNAAISTDSNSDNSQVQPERSMTPSNEVEDKPSPFTAKSPIVYEEEDFPDDDEWSDEAQNIKVELDQTDVPAQGIADTLSKSDEVNNEYKQGYTEIVSLSKSSFIQDVYDRQSFDDYDATPSLDSMLDKKEIKHTEEPTLSNQPKIQMEELRTNQTENYAPEDTLDLEDVKAQDDEDSISKPVGGQPSPSKCPQDPYSSFQSEPPSSHSEPVIDEVRDEFDTDNLTNSKTLLLQDIGSKTQKDTKAGHHTPDTTSDPESIEPNCLVSGATDSFVEFMRECLKSRQDDEPSDPHHGLPSKNELPRTGVPPSHASPMVMMDLEQEQLTISALKELGSSQEEEAEEQLHQPSVKVSDQDKADSIVISVRQTSFTSTPSPPTPQTHPASDSTYSKEVEAIDEWVAEAYHLAEHVLTAILIHLSVKDLIHWRDPKKSGAVFGLSMLLLLSLAAFSVISVMSYLLLALLCVTITFRIYKSVIQAVQKSSEGHPFKVLMEKDLTIPPDTFRKHVDASLTYINRALKQMSRLFLVEDLVDSLKLAVVMWLLTYVGAVFNGITILILADILLFAIPPIYEKNKTQIDQYIDLVRTQVSTTIAKLQEKLPGAMKRSKAE